MQNLSRIVNPFRCLIFVIAFSSSLHACAQGVPKAYEAISYRGMVNGRLVVFVLADGYIGASSLKMYLPGKMKPVVFEPDAGVGDEHNRLKFVSARPGTDEYLILDNMQDVYEKTPAFIAGYYFLNHKKIPVKFRPVKSHKRQPHSL